MDTRAKSLFSGLNFGESTSSTRQASEQPGLAGLLSGLGGMGSEPPICHLDLLRTIFFWLHLPAWLRSTISVPTAPYSKTEIIPSTGNRS